MRITISLRVPHFERNLCPVLLADEAAIGPGRISHLLVFLFSIYSGYNERVIGLHRSIKNIIVKVHYTRAIDVYFLYRHLHPACKSTSSSHLRHVYIIPSHIR